MIYEDRKDTDRKDIVGHWTAANMEKISGVGSASFISFNTLAEMLKEKHPWRTVRGFTLTTNGIEIWWA